MFFSRVTLLELLFAQLREEDSDECGVPPSVARFLASTFQKGCGAVLTLATGSVSSEEVQKVNQIRVNCVLLGELCSTLSFPFSDWYVPSLTRTHTTSSM